MPTKMVLEAEIAILRRHNRKMSDEMCDATEFRSRAVDAEAELTRLTAQRDKLHRVVTGFLGCAHTLYQREDIEEISLVKLARAAIKAEVEGK